MIATFLNWPILVEAWPVLLAGLGVTLGLSAVIVPLGFAGGLALAMLSTVRSRALRLALAAWIDVFRAFPPLVLLVLLYAGLPFAGLTLGGFACAVLGFFLNNSAYYAEILRAGIGSVPTGLSEAARSTGLGAVATLRHVVLPQAIRAVLPDLLSNTLEVVKGSSLASVVALPELLYEARQAQALTYNPTPIVAAAALYALILWPCVRLLSRLERGALARRGRLAAGRAAVFARR